MVPLDFSEIKDWSTIEPGVEIFITNQYDKFIDCNGDGDTRMALLNPQPLKGSKG